jgi:hypothetical protein
MRTLVFAAMILSLLAIAVSADVPAFISYQGRLTDDAGQPVTGTLNIKFKIYGSPDGDDSLWSSGFQSVDVEDGLFKYNLGSNVPLTKELFITNDSRYLGITVESEAEMDPRTQFITTAYAYHSAYADTASYAHASPGGASSGWVDDGNVVRLATNSDRVGIGTSSASEPLVIGKDFANYPGNWVVIGDDTPDETTGLIIGEDVNNQSWLEWRIDSNYLTIGSVESNTDHSYTLNLHGGRVGIKCTDPSEPLVVGQNVTHYPGNWIVVGDDTPGEYAGLIIGENADNHAYMEWGVNDNLLSLGTSDAGIDYWSTLNVKQGNIGINCIDPEEDLVVGADLGSYGGTRITIGDTDPGVNTGLNIGKDSNNRSWITWNTTNNDGLQIGTKENGTNYGTVLSIGGGTVDVPDNAISDNEILDEPGVAREAKSNNIEVGYSWTTICSRTCNFPTSGFAVVLLTCEYQNRTEWRHFTFGITDNSGAAPRLYTQYIEYIPDSPNGEYWGTFSMHEVFAVGAGNNTFSFLAKKVEESFPVYTWDVSITVMFFPTAYGTVTMAAEDGNGEPEHSSISAQPMLFLSDELSSASESVRPESDQVAALRAEFEAELQALRKEIAEIKQDQ